VIADAKLENVNSLSSCKSLPRLIMVPYRHRGGGNQYKVSHLTSEEQVRLRVRGQMPPGPHSRWTVISATTSG